MGWIIIIIIMFVLGLILYKSINIINPNEMGIKVFLGKPGNKVNSGLHLVLWPLQRIERYTKEIMEFKFAVPSIMTKRGKIAGYKEPIETTEIDIICTLYAYFDSTKLDRTIQFAPGKTAKTIGSKLVPYVTDIIRTQGGRLPWRLINQERRFFISSVLHRMVVGQEGPQINELPESKQGEKVDPNIDIEYSFNNDDDNWEKGLTEEKLRDQSPFVQFGLKDVTLAIEDINFVDPEMRKAISAPEKARVLATAKRLEAEAERYTRVQEGEGSAIARKEMIAVIKDHKDLEFLYALREMAQGTSNTILYQIPSAFEERFKDLLGGNKIGEYFRMLSPKDQKVVETVLIDTINKLKSGGGK